jgi:tetratricopeptide (TPR) repeat protein
MRRSLGILLAVLILVVAPARAQIGKRVSLMAGSPEDKAYAEITATKDPAQKLALMDKFLADFGQTDMAVVAYELYISYYQAEKNNAKVIEYCEKLLGADPDNLAAALNEVRAAQEKGDQAALFSAGERVGGIMTRYKAKPAPEGTRAGDWEQEKERNLADAQSNVSYVEYTLFTSAYQAQNPAAKAALFERFVSAFPDSPYTPNAQALVAAAYQQAQNYPRMLEFANRILARDANNLSMLLLLADYYSERGEQLDKAEEYAKKSSGLLASAKKPEGVPDDQWKKQVDIQKGLALSARGQVYIQRHRDAQALEAFSSAAPLLKADPVTYARNQYRMGFALLNLKRVNEATAALTEAASIPSPYRALAQEKLNSIGAAPAKRPAKKSP